MPAMRALALLLLVLPCCRSTPERVDDKTGPERAFETFRGAVARGEYDREWACLSRGLREALGLRSRAEWGDVRVTVLHRRHRFIRGLLRADVVGSQKEPGGRVMLRLDFPFGYKGRVWMAPAAVLRIGTEGDRDAVLKDLDGLTVVVSPSAAGVAIPPGAATDIREALAGKRVESFVARIEWVLDGFAAGDDTPEKIRKDLERAQ